MNRQIFTVALLIPASSLSCATHGAAKTRERSDPEGQSLAAELQSLRPETDLEASGFIRVRDGSGKRKVFPFRFKIMLENSRWKSVYEALDQNGGVQERLTVVHTRGQANRYHRARIGEMDRPLGEGLAGNQAMIPFSQTDFWLADLGREFLFWPEQRIVDETRIRMRKSRPCKVLESRNPEPGASGYTRVRSWIDSETGGIILAEAYGSDGKLMKEFEVGGVTKVNGRYELEKLEMRDLRTDSQTVFEFKYSQEE